MHVNGMCLKLGGCALFDVRIFVILLRTYNVRLDVKQTTTVDVVRRQDASSFRDASWRHLYKEIDDKPKIGNVLWCFMAFVQQEAFVTCNRQGQLVINHYLHLHWVYSSSHFTVKALMTSFYLQVAIIWRITVYICCRFLIKHVDHSTLSKLYFSAYFYLFTFTQNKNEWMP